MHDMFNSIHPSIHPSTNPPIHPSIHPSIRPSTHLYYFKKIQEIIKKGKKENKNVKYI